MEKDTILRIFKAFFLKKVAFFMIFSAKNDAKLLSKGTLSILYLFTGAGMYNLMSYCMFANWVWYAFAVAGLVYWRFTRKDLERPMKINLIIPFFFIGLCLLLLVFRFFHQY